MALVHHMDHFDRPTEGQPQGRVGEPRGGAHLEKDDREGEVILRALGQLAEALEENARDQQVMADRIRELRKARASGVSWEDILSEEEGIGTMQLLSRMLNRLSAASGALRREMVHGLRDEGVSVPTIARLFGVTHQRVSNLLRRGGG